MSEEGFNKSNLHRWIAVVLAVATPCITFYTGYVRQSYDIGQLTLLSNRHDEQIKELQNRVRTTEQDIAVIKQGTLIIKENVKEILIEIKELTRKR